MSLNCMLLLIAQFFKGILLPKLQIIVFSNRTMTCSM